MTSSMEVRIGIVSAVLVALILVVTGVNVAHAYNSSLNGTGDAPVSYLTVDVLGDDDRHASVLTFDTSDGTIVDSAKIRIYSNTATEAYVYGYFTSEIPKGVAVESIELEFSDGSTAKLFRDAYRGTLSADGAVGSTVTALGSTTQGFPHYADFEISSVTVHCYAGLPDEGDIIWSHDKGVTHEGGTVGADSAMSISDFEFHFVASRLPLIETPALDDDEDEP